VGQALTNSAVGTFVIWLACSWRPGRQVSRESFTDLFRFGANILGGRMLLFASRRSDDFLIGLVLGSIALGLYTIAYRILLLLTDVMIWTIEGVAFPLFSRLQGHAVRIQRAFGEVTHLCVAVAVPAFLALAALAPEITEVAFGAKWAESAPVMRALALVGVPHSVIYLNKAVVNAAGRPDLSLRVAFVTAVLNVVAFAAVVHWGILAVAISYTVCAYALLPVSVWSVGRVLELDVGAYVRAFVAPCLSALVMVFAIAVAKSLLASASELAQLAALAAIGAAAYGLMLWLIDRALVRSVVADVKQLFAGA
jgi:polysaccharide transporter, PST family